jgi:hypothetical protein
MTINLLDKIKKLTSRVLQFLRIKTQKEIAETLSSHKLWKRVNVRIKDKDVTWVICGKIGDYYIVWYYLNGKVENKWITKIINDEQTKFLNEENQYESCYKIWTKVKIPIKSWKKSVIACIIGYNENRNKYIVWYVDPTGKEIKRKFRYTELTKREVETYRQWMI